MMIKTKYAHVYDDFQPGISGRINDQSLEVFLKLGRGKVVDDFLYYEYGGARISLD